MKGATGPGAPVVLLKQNASIAWGITSADTDTQDLPVETVDPANSAQYLTPDGPGPFGTRDETIHVKGGPDGALHVRARRGTGRCSPTNVRNSPISRVPASDGARLHGPRRQGYDFRSADARDRRAQLGRAPRRVATLSGADAESRSC